LPTKTATPESPIITIKSQKKCDSPKETINLTIKRGELLGTPTYGFLGSDRLGVGTGTGYGGSGSGSGFGSELVELKSQIFSLQQISNYEAAQSKASEMREYYGKLAAKEKGKAKRDDVRFGTGEGFDKGAGKGRKALPKVEELLCDPDMILDLMTE
jgi:hypothetical protein